jgi:hypothetical protein
MAAADSKRILSRFYLFRCPLHNECTKAAWSKQRYCESMLDPDEVRNKAYKHLNTSGLHRDTQANILETVNAAQVIVEVVEGDWWQNKHDIEVEDRDIRDRNLHEPLPPPAEVSIKRQRSPSTPSDARRKKPSTPPKKATRTPKPPPIGTRAERDERLCAIATKAATAAVTSICATSKSSASAPPSYQRLPPGQDRLDAVRSSACRVMTAASKAAHLCNQAAVAFQVEAANLKSLVDELEKIA